MTSSLIGRRARLKYHVDDNASGVVVAVALHDQEFWLLVELESGVLEMHDYSAVIMDKSDPPTGSSCALGPQPKEPT